MGIKDRFYFLFFIPFHFILYSCILQDSSFYTSFFIHLFSVVLHHLILILSFYLKAEDKNLIKSRLRDMHINFGILILNFIFRHSMFCLRK